MSRVLIIVQNLPVPFDRRVWLECQALVSGGYQVAVVCPKGTGDPAYEVVKAVALYKYRPYAPGGSKLELHHRVRLLVPRDGLADAEGPALRPVRGPAGLQPAGHLLADRADAARTGPHRVRVRPP